MKKAAFEDELEQFRQGNTVVFKSVYEHYYRPLYYYAFKIIYDEAVAEDIVTETMIKLWNGREKFKSEAQIRNFLYLSVRCGAIDEQRARERHQRSHAEIKYLSQGVEATADQALILAQVLEKLYEEIRNLPPKCRQVFEMIFLEDKSTDEVAAALEVTTKTVLNQKLRALGILKISLSKKDLLVYLLVQLLFIRYFFLMDRLPIF